MSLNVEKQSHDCVAGMMDHLLRTGWRGCTHEGFQGTPKLPERVENPGYKTVQSRSCFASIAHRLQVNAGELKRLRHDYEP